MKKNSTVRAFVCAVNSWWSYEKGTGEKAVIPKTFVQLLLKPP